MKAMVVSLALALAACGSPWRFECEAAMEKFSASGCGDSSRWKGYQAKVCPLADGPNVAACERALSAASTCHAQVMRSTSTCFFGATELSDTCGGDVLRAVHCLETTNATGCAGAPCQFDNDCSQGSRCNSETNRCVRLGASCDGLPCRWNADCPNNAVCNSASKQCQAQ